MEIGIGHSIKVGRNPNLIYIMSHSYTGSTLLTCLLATHPAISTIGELKASSMGNINKYQCSCGEAIRKCPFWRRVAMEMKSHGLHFSVDNFQTDFRSDSIFCNYIIQSGIRSLFFECARSWALGLFPHCRNTLNSILDRNHMLIQVICELLNGNNFLDGSKDPIRLKHFLNSGFWNIKTIYLIRDGRGTTNSFMKHNNVTMKVAANEWIRTHNECDRMVARIKPERLLTVKYEDLCKDPQNQMNEIYNFIGLDPSLGHLEYDASVHHILGNKMRLRNINRVRLDEKWKTELLEMDLAIFENIAGNLNRSYGYK